MGNTQAMREKQINYWANLLLKFQGDLPDWRAERIAQMIFDDGYRRGKRVGLKKKRKV